MNKGFIKHEEPGKHGNEQPQQQIANVDESQGREMMREGSFLFQNKDWTETTRPLHAHFDCFSGAAGDMMFAACLDAAGIDSDRLRDHISQCINEGLPPIADEFQITSSRVWRGLGSIAAKHVRVKSVYSHQAAPVPQKLKSDKDQVAPHSHACHHESHSHSHTHSHSHSGHGDCISSESSGEAENHQDHTHDHGGPLRNLPEIRKMLQNAPEKWIPGWVKDKAIKTFTQLALAEAAVHCAESEDVVHFHEVGAVDSIVDTVGTLLALHFLGVESVSCSRLPLGEGSIRTDHGILPVPAPAALRLMIGMPTTKGPPGVTGELVTPTGAALLQVLTRMNPVSPVGEPPAFTLRSIGVGAGSKDFPRHPNILRVMLGERS